jgi:hypothetical protein
MAATPQRGSIASETRSLADPAATNVTGGRLKITFPMPRQAQQWGNPQVSDGVFAVWQADRLRCSESPAGVAQQAEQPSCKRQASGSNPLTGSQFGDRLYLASARFRGTPSVAEGRMEQLPGGSFRVCVYAGTDPLIGVRSA